MKNARKSDRQRRRVRARIEGTTSAFTSDVGAGGFCLHLFRQLVPGTPVSGSLLVNGLEVSFTGRVAWALPGDARLRVPSRAGICFSSTPPGLEALLHASGPSAT